MTGLERINNVFETTRAEKRAALMPYFTLGFPSREKSLNIIRAIAEAGADLIELGLPFSDPLADGPTIQQSTQVALDNGIRTKDCLVLVKELRRAGFCQPFLLMGYFNPIHSFGEENFVKEASTAGADGLIVPDLPIDEAGRLEAACAEQGLALIYMAAPTTPQDRLKQVTSHCTGFVYIVSLTGVTGARKQVSAGLEDFLRRVRSVTEKPLAVGFGISTPEQAASVGKMADGVIIGSALIDVAAKADKPVQACKDFIRAIHEAIIQ